MDVDALWATMNSSTSANKTATALSVQTTTGDNGVELDPVQASDPAGNEVEAGQGVTNPSAVGKPSRSSSHVDEEMVTIKRTYEFAGEIISEEKRVPKSSAEGRLYLDSLQQQQARTLNSPSSSASKQKNASTPALRRPKKRSSMFDPHSTSTSTGTATSALSSSTSLTSAPTTKTTSSTTNSQGTMTTAGTPSHHAHAASTASARPKQTLNTVEKSKLDWAGFVDKEGITDELDEHGRAKEGYLGRMDFLGRVQANREEDLKKAKKL